MFDHTKVKLGKLQPKHSPQTPQLSRYLKRGAAQRAWYRSGGNLNHHRPHPMGVPANIPVLPDRPTSPHGPAAATTLSNIAGTGVVGGTDTVSAKLTSLGTPLAGQTLAFKFPNGAVFHAKTNTAGVATIAGIPAAKKTGNYIIMVAFAGGTQYSPARGYGNLVISSPAPPVPPPAPPHPVPPPTSQPAPPAASLPAPPLTEDFGSKVSSWPMMLNDTVGDCTCAAAGHMIECWTANIGAAVTLVDAQILTAYEAVSGYVPGKPDTDNGATCEDVLNYWHTTGIGGHKILGYASFDPANTSDIEDSLYLFGGVYLGINMPISAQNQTGPGLVWDVPAGGATGNGEPGSWGGHCVPITEYDASGLTVITWGLTQRMTWKFLQVYCPEAYAVLSQDWIAANGLSPDDFNLAQLQADLAVI